MSSIEQISVAGVMTVLASRLPDGVAACEYQVAYDPELEMPVIRVAMILESLEWNDHAMAACALATDVAWDTLSPLGYVPDVICRTKVEHDETRTEEKWEHIGGDC